MSDTVDLRLILPASISVEARAMLEVLGNAYAAMPRAAVPVIQEDFDAAAARSAAIGAHFFGAAVSSGRVVSRAADAEIAEFWDAHL